MTDVIKGTSGQNRYLVMTEQDARQIMSSVPNLKFYRCEQLGEFNSVLGGLSVTPKIELCHKLNMIGTNYDSFLMSQFKDGILQMYLLELRTIPRRVINWPMALKVPFILPLLFMG